MSRAAALIQRAAYLLWLGLIPWAAFLSYSLSVLAASRQHAVIEAETELLKQLPNLSPVGITVWDTTARDTRSLMTVLDEMNIRLDVLKETAPEPLSPKVKTSKNDGLAKRAVKDALRLRVPKDSEGLETPEDDARLETQPIAPGEPDRLTRLVDAMDAADAQDAKRAAFTVHSITKYRFIAHEGACQTCQADDGTVYPTTIRRAHHNGCRCDLEPFTTYKIEREDDAA